MMINEIGSISNKSFSLNNVNGNIQDSAQSNIRGNNITGSIGSTVPTGKISGQPIIEVNGQNIKLKEACTQFEQIFIKYMVDKMWSSTDAGSGKQSIEKSVWQDYFNNEISKVIAESSMTGISETLFDQLAMTTLHAEDGPEAGAAPDSEVQGTENEVSMAADENINI